MFYDDLPGDVRRKVRQEFELLDEREMAAVWNEEVMFGREEEEGDDDE